MVRFDPLQKWAPRRRNAAIGGYETSSLWANEHLAHKVGAPGVQSGVAHQ
jgi:hypothetical protein